MKKIICILLCLILAGCGFHLRGHEPLPPQLHVLYIQSDNPYGAFTKLLNRTLHGIGIILAKSSKDAPYTLQIISETSNQELTSQGASGQLSTYLLTYSVVYQLLDVHGRVISGPTTVTASRSYSAAANQILGDTNVQSSLKSDMQLDAVVQLLNHLRSRNSVQALKQDYSETTHATSP